MLNRCVALVEQVHHMQTAPFVPNLSVVLQANPESLLRRPAAPPAPDTALMVMSVDTISKTQGDATQRPPPFNDGRGRTLRML